MGGVLLGSIIGTFGPYLDDDALEDLDALIDDVEHDRHIAQPRMRHRFQTDHVGLQRVTYRLIADGDHLGLSFPTEKATPAQHVLTAVYSASKLDLGTRPAVIAVMRRAMTYPARDDADLIRHLTGNARSGLHAFSHPVQWALEVLDITVDAREFTPSGSSVDSPGSRRGGEVADASNGAGVHVASSMTHHGSVTGERTTGLSQGIGELPAGAMKLPTRREIQRAFRLQLRRSHPDHGAERQGAAKRIAELTEARRILLDA